MKTLTRGALNKFNLFRWILVLGSSFAIFLHAVPSKASFLQRFLSAGSGLDAGSPFSLFGCFMSLQACAFFAKSTVSKLKSEAM